MTDQVMDRLRSDFHPTVEWLTSLRADAGCAPCQELAGNTPRPSDQMATAADDTPPVELHNEQPTWEGVLCVEGELTGDSRLIEAGALRWELDNPIPLMYVEESVGGHDGQKVVGLITEITRAGDEITAKGIFDLGSEHGREAFRLVSQKIMNGVSVDLDDVSFEVRLAKEVMDQVAAEAEGEGAPVEVPDEEDEEGRVIVAKVDPDEEIMALTSARIRGATLVSIPAFTRARIESTGDVEEALVAAGVQKLDNSRPPREWFTDPKLSGPTALTFTEDGRMYGHLATWDSCHIGVRNECVQPPRSATDYAYFHVGVLRTSDGSDVPVGRITLNTGHAGESMSAANTLAHYDNTGTAVADVVAGEDQYGIWVSGAIRSGLSEKTLRTLRSSPLSGDWRRVGASLELVAALAVNVPGFPIPRPKGLVASGKIMSLVAAGMVPPRKVARPGTPEALSNDDLRYLKKLAQREKRARIEAMAAQVQDGGN